MSVYAGEGNDTGIGGNGHSYFLGGEGHDDLWGGAGLKYLFGGAGRDWMHGGLGDDYLSGDGDGDFLHGGEGHDVLHGGAADDYLYGDSYGLTSGNDLLDGGTGADYLDGQGGDDTLTFSADATWPYMSVTPGGNYLWWGENRTFDYHRGGDGSDRLVMTDGHDAFLLHDPSLGLMADGVEAFEGRDGWDHIDLSSPTYSYGGSSIDGGAGTDVLYGGAGDDWMDAGQWEYADGGEGLFDLNAWVPTVTSAAYFDGHVGHRPRLHGG